MSQSTETLSESQQRRNSLVFLVNNAMVYLVAPVFYVGVLHAAILESYGASDTVANLPEAVYFWMMPAPVLIAWAWPSAHWLRPMLVTALLAMGGAGLVVAVMVVTAPPSWIVVILVAHAAIIAIGNGVRQMCLWELIGRSLSPELRGWTLGWTFGLGPVFAVVGSCASQLVLSGSFLDLVRTSPIPSPWNYVALFGSTVPAMGISAALIGLAALPAQAPATERTRPSDVLSGLRQYFLRPLIMAAAIAFLLTLGGTLIMNNLSLYAREAMGEAPERYAGLQLALRFGFKCLVGFALGWLVTRIHAKASLLATTGMCLAGVAWAWLVPGRWYLLSFGLLGAGELFYVYYVNYIVGCSTAERIRENTAYTNLITMMVGVLPLVFGAVSDRFGFHASFVLAMAIFAAAMLIVMWFLPRQPRAPATAQHDT